VGACEINILVGDTGIFRHVPVFAELTGAKTGPEREHVFLVQIRLFAGTQMSAISRYFLKQAVF